MKSKKVWWIIAGIFFWWHPLFYVVLFIYFMIHLGKKSNNSKVNQNTNVNNVAETQAVPRTSDFVLKCTKCGTELKINSKFCGNCGEPFDGNNVKVELSPTAKEPIGLKSNLSLPQQNFIKPGSFDSIFGLSEDAMVEEFLNRELKKSNVDITNDLIPHDILKRKRILNIIFSVLVFIYISLIFFHFPILTYIIGLIILFIVFRFTRKYNIMKYLKKQLKARSSEKVSNIVMNMKESLTKDTSKNVLLVGILVALILPLIIFIKPIILYEKMEGGYGVRYYIFGVTNFTSATIPEVHNNEKVISLRGNTFSNMPFLDEVTLSDSIIEIRGQAFKNNKALKTVKLPSKLSYLGGGAFYNCTSLESIEIPDSVTYIGGEAFYNAKNLKSVKLSENLTEIRGSTFENCYSLESIVIPDSVTRIGGHAFYGNRALSSVSISPNSELTEIGSSAFRLCTSLYEIMLPRTVYVNERAFKESPTVKKFYNEYTCNQYGCTTTY